MLELVEKRAPGRPPGKTFPREKVIQLTDAQAETLRRLAGELDCSENEVVRRALAAFDAARRRRAARDLPPG